ncbi:MAG: ATP-binding cassette domain-containing protein, partial [Clostridium paraputrificum]
MKPGETTILLGLNGAGKTTLLKTISGLVKYKNGKIKYDNNEFLKWSNKERGKLISYIPQYIHTNQNYMVEDIILMGITPYLGIFDMPSEEHYKMVDDILKKLNIYHLKNKCIGELSGGERRMVYLGRILMQECKIRLLD